MRTAPQSHDQRKQRHKQNNGRIAASSGTQTAGLDIAREELLSTLTFAATGAATAAARLVTNSYQKHKPREQSSNGMHDLRFPRSLYSTLSDELARRRAICVFAGLGRKSSAEPSQSTPVR